MDILFVHVTLPKLGITIFKWDFVEVFQVLQFQTKPNSGSLKLKHFPVSLA